MLQALGTITHYQSILEAYHFQEAIPHLSFCSIDRFAICYWLWHTKRRELDYRFVGCYSRVLVAGQHIR